MDSVAPKLGMICVRASLKCPTTVVVPRSVTLVARPGRPLRPGWPGRPPADVLVWPRAPGPAAAASPSLSIANNDKAAFINLG